MRILIVDNDPCLLSHLSRALQMCGHSVFTANEADRAVRSARENVPDSVVTDLLLGPARGSDLIRRLRTEAICQPCVLMTGNLDYGVPADLADVPVVYKPFSAKRLLLAIGSQVEAWRQRDAGRPA